MLRYIHDMPQRNLKSSIAALKGPYTPIRTAHASVVYDEWFSTEVGQAIEEANDPNTQWVSNEEAKMSWAKKRGKLDKLARKDCS